MKIKPEHFKYLKEAVEPLDTDQRRDVSIALNLTDMRYRWDLTYLLPEVSKFIRETLYDYCDDTHIDTALRKIVRPL